MDQNSWTLMEEVKNYFLFSFVITNIEEKGKAKLERYFRTSVAPEKDLGFIEVFSSCKLWMLFSLTPKMVTARFGSRHSHLLDPKSLSSGKTKSGF